MTRFFIFQVFVSGHLVFDRASPTFFFFLAFILGCDSFVWNNILVGFFIEQSNLNSVNLGTRSTTSFNFLFDVCLRSPACAIQNTHDRCLLLYRYILLQGLAGVAGGFLQIVRLIIYYVKLFLLGSTPRSIWGIKYGTSSVAWGTTFPGITLLVVISTVFSVE